MNKTGTYIYQPGAGMVKISDEVPKLAQSVWMPKGDVSYYDKSAQRKFESRREKRMWLKENGMKEGGIVDKKERRWDGPIRNATKPTLEQKAERKRQQELIKAQGGVNALLDRLQSSKNVV